MSKVPNFQPSSIETIDGAFLEYVEGLNLFATTINGFQKVPVIWSTAERAYQIKDNREIRDINGSLIPPIISIERISTNKDPQKKGMFQANLSPNQDRIVYSQQINQEKTSNFSNADSLRHTGQINFKTKKKNEKIVYKHVSVRIPIYITVEYKINIITNYQTQMNEIVQPFMSRVAQNYFLINKDGHRYECFMDQNFSQDSISDLGENERKYKSSITVKVLGYLIGEGNNQEDPQLKTEENPVEIKFPKENMFLIEEDKKKIKRFYQPNIGTPVSSGILKKKVFQITIVEGISEYIVNHDFNSRDLLIIVRENFGDYEKVEVAIDYSNLNYTLFDMGDAEVGQTYTIMILG